MKKVYLFVALCATVLSSCSSDDDSDNNVSNAPLSVTVNGTRTAFNDIEVEVDGYRIYVTAMTENHSEIISFEADMGYTGDDSIYYVTYSKDNDIYYENEGAITNNVEVSTEHRLKGTFQGIATNFNNGEIGDTVNLTDGSFDLAY